MCRVAAGRAGRADGLYFLEIVIEFWDMARDTVTGARATAPLRLYGLRLRPAPGASAKATRAKGAVTITRGSRGRATRPGVRRTDGDALSPTVGCRHVTVRLSGVKTHGRESGKALLAARINGRRASERILRIFVVRKVAQRFRLAPRGPATTMYDCTVGIHSSGSASSSTSTAVTSSRISS